MIEKKLTGKVIGGQQDLGVSVTVQDLIEQATSLENLSEGRWIIYPILERVLY